VIVIAVRACRRRQINPWADPRTPGTKPLLLASHRLPALARLLRPNQLLLARHSRVKAAVAQARLARCSAVTLTLPWAGVSCPHPLWVVLRRDSLSSLAPPSRRSPQHRWQPHTLACGRGLVRRWRRRSCHGPLQPLHRGPCQGFARNHATRNLAPLYNSILDSAAQLCSCVGTGGAGRRCDSLHGDQSGSPVATAEKEMLGMCWHGGSRLSWVGRQRSTAGADPGQSGRSGTLRSNQGVGGTGRGRQA
jgi:hypothetical protein